MAAPTDVDSILPTAFHLTERDRQILMMGDENYRRLTWADAKGIIATNDLENFTRLPSQLLKYLQWSEATKRQYGSMTNFLLQERLHWQPESSSDVVSSTVKTVEPLADSSDCRILRNDWPYGFDASIVHICVWLKHKLPVDEENGLLTPSSRAMVEDFVQQKFVKKLEFENQDRVLWFKNWTRLQSVRGLEHFHVLLRGCSAEEIARVVD